MVEMRDVYFGLSVLMNVQHRISLRSTSYAGQAIQHPMKNEK